MWLSPSGTSRDFSNSWTGAPGTSARPPHVVRVGWVSRLLMAPTLRGRRRPPTDPVGEEHAPGRAGGEGREVTSRDRYRPGMVRLGTVVVVVPTEHPIRLAEDAAALDTLGAGRLEPGPGRGFNPPPGSTTPGTASALRAPSPRSPPRRNAE
ncbi:LLM class flavin-dependent oxidoreductase [Embleya sp. NPDC001921]